MQTVALSSLRARVRKKIDSENSSVPTSAQVDTAINNAIRRLHARIAQLSEDEATASAILTTVADRSYVEVPSDFLVLRGIEWFPHGAVTGGGRITEAGEDRLTELGGTRDMEGTALVAAVSGDQRFETLHRWQFRERARWDSTRGWSSGRPVAYRAVGKDAAHVERIELLPIPQATHAIRIWYVPTAATLTLDTDTYDGRSGFDEYVVLEASIALAIDEESDVQAWMLERDRIWTQEIAPLFAVRDQATPDRVVDVESVFVGEEFGIP